MQIPALVRQTGHPPRSSADTKPAIQAPPKVAVASAEQRAVKAGPKSAPKVPTADEILAALQGQIQPVNVPLTYSLGLVLVLLAMVVLTAVYVLLIGFVCYGVYYHAVNHTGLLNVSGGGRAQAAAFVLYLSVFFIGGVLVLFMVKPIFARPGKRTAPRSLHPERETLLFAFVGRVCDAVGAPHPKRIDVDTQVNASASFRRGWLSMLGNDLVLTIGLPLVTGLNLRQFAGVLAHEFGHFSQGAGMRLTYVIRSISWWFTRVVYERDEWDDRLVRWARGTDFRLALFVHAARLMVWVTRRVLWVFMILGHAVSGFMLRQMEFDADLHEARLAGSDTFESTARRLRVLGVATQGAFADLGEFYRDGRLSDDLPRLIMANVDQLPTELTAKLNEGIDESTTGWFDTHPSDKDRIEAAREEAAPGIFRLESPSALLFADFSALSKTTTWDYYRQIFGSEFKPTDMRSVDELLARQSKEQEASKALRRYFQDVFTPLRPLRLPAAWVGAPKDPKANVALIQSTRKLLVARAPEYSDAFQKYDDADSTILQTCRAKALIDADFKVKADTFPVPMTSTSDANAVRSKALAQQEQFSRKLDALEETVARRLIAALELLHVPSVAAKIPDAAKIQEETSELLSSLSLVNRQMPALLQFRNDHASLAILLENLQGQEQNRALFEAIAKHMKTAMAALHEFHGTLSVVDFPLDHGRGQMSIGTYALPELPAPDDLGAIYGASEKLLDALPSLYVRLAARLALIAEQIESVLKLPPLPEPKPKLQEEPAAAGAAALV